MTDHFDEQETHAPGKLMPGGFYQWDVSNVRAAIELAERIKKQKGSCFFRGQRDASWPVASSFARLDEVLRQEAQRKIVDFATWVRAAPAMVPYLQSDDAIIAAAQHHGICATTFIDFSKEPTVAAWFATDGAIEGQFGAIYLVDPADVSELFATISEAGPTLRFLEVDVDNLWRLQAQNGLFLETQISVSRVWPFDRIVFPQTLDAPIIERRRIYPDRRSHLEQMIDHYKLLRSFEENSKMFWIDNPHIAHISMDDGEEDASDEPEITAAKSSSEGPREKWSDIDIDSEPPKVTFGELSGPTREISDIVQRRRSCTDLMSIIDSSHRRNGSLQEQVNLLWAGVRPHHYANHQIANAISALSRFYELLCDVPLQRGDELKRAADKLFLMPMEIEMGMKGGGSTRSWVSANSLASAMTPAGKAAAGIESGPISSIKMGNLFDRLRGRTLGLFDPRALTNLFASEIVPWQVAARRPLIAYWPEHVYSLGRP